MKAKKLSVLPVLFISLLGNFAHSALEPKFLFEDDATLLTTNIQVVVHTGAADDPAGKNGLTNMLSELVLRGTKHRSREGFQGELERLGGTVSVQVFNDLIIFTGQVIHQNTTAFIGLLEDALLNPAFAQKEFASLKEEILSGIANIKNNNNRLSGLALRKEMFAGSVLEQPVEGSLTSIKNIKLDDLVRAYNNNFHRGNLIFAISSPMKEEQLKKTFTKIWLKFPDGAKVTRKSIAPLVPSKVQLVVVHKPQTSTGSVSFGQAGILAQDPNRFALELANFAFGGEPLVSRLFRIVRAELGYTYAIRSRYTGFWPLSNQQGVFSIQLTPSVEFTTKAIVKTLSMWKEFMTGGLKEDEKLLASDSVVNSYPFDFDSAQKRLFEKLYSYIYNVPILSPEDFGKTIRALTPEKILGAVKERQKADGWVISVVADSDVFEKQLAEEQASLPESQRLKIAKKLTPDDIIQ